MTQDEVKEKKPQRRRKETLTEQLYKQGRAADGTSLNYEPMDHPKAPPVQRNVEVRQDPEMISSQAVNKIYADRQQIDFDKECEQSARQNYKKQQVAIEPNGKFEMVYRDKVKKIDRQLDDALYYERAKTDIKKIDEHALPSQQKHGLLVKSGRYKQDQSMVMQSYNKAKEPLTNPEGMRYKIGQYRDNGQFIESFKNDTMMTNIVQRVMMGRNTIDNSQYIQTSDMVNDYIYTNKDYKYKQPQQERLDRTQYLESYRGSQIPIEQQIQPRNKENIVTKNFQQQYIQPDVKQGSDVINVMSYNPYHRQRKDDKFERYFNQNPYDEYL